MLNRVVPGLLCLAVVLSLSGCGEYSGASTESGGNDAATAAVPAPGIEAPAVADLPAAVTGQKVEAPQTDSVLERTANRAPKEIQAAEVPLAPTTQPAATVALEPATLDLGTVPANQYATGSVTLTNTGDTPVTIDECRTSCGCTTTNCPKGQQLQPGESTSVDVRMTAGSRARRISKTVTFVVDGTPALRMPVTVEVVTYVVMEPSTIDPAKSPDGRVVLRASDDEPFRILSMTPAVIQGFDAKPAVEHEIFLPWEQWRELNEPRRLTFNLDHPLASRTSLLIRGARSQPARQQNLTADRATPSTAVATPQPDGRRITDAPIEFLQPDAKLAIAVKRGDVDTVKKAVEAGMSEPVRDSMLTMAARHGKVEVINTLLAAGADIEATDKRGRTPLMSAVQSRNPDAINALIVEGADVDARDQVQATALFRASGPFGDVAVVNTLIEAGAEVNVSDKNGMTPLIWAVRFGDASRVQALVNAGADVGIRDGRGLRAIDYARNRSDAKATRIVEILEPVAESEADSG